MGTTTSTLSPTPATLPNANKFCNNKHLDPQQQKRQQQLNDGNNITTDNNNSGKFKKTLQLQQQQQELTIALNKTNVKF